MSLFLLQQSEIFRYYTSEGRLDRLSSLINSLPTVFYRCVLLLDWYLSACGSSLQKLGDKGKTHQKIKHQF